MQNPAYSMVNGGRAAGLGRQGGRAGGTNRVPILCNQLLLQLLTHIFETLQNVYEHIEDVHEAV